MLEDDQIAAEEDIDIVGEETGPPTKLEKNIQEKIIGQLSVI